MLRKKRTTGVIPTDRKGIGSPLVSLSSFLMQRKELFDNFLNCRFVKEIKFHVLSCRYYRSFFKFGNEQNTTKKMIFFCNIYYILIYNKTIYQQAVYFYSVVRILRIMWSFCTHYNYCLILFLIASALNDKH